MGYIRGHVQHIMFQAQTYYVLKFGVEDTDFPYRDAVATVSGHLVGLPALRPGTSIHLMGEWVNHAKYGRQLQPRGWLPWAATTRDIESFLGQTLKVGGEDLVEFLVKKFGLDTFDVFNDRPEEIRALSEDEDHSLRLERALLTWQSARGLSDLSVFLQDYGLGPETVAGIWAKFGPTAIEVISKNPYRLIVVEGFTFGRADHLASQLNIPRNDPRRIEGAVLWALKQNAREGHLYMRRGELPSQISALTEKERVDPFDVADLYKASMEAAAKLIKQGGVVLSPDVGLYLPDLHLFEREAAKKVAEHLTPSEIQIDLKEFLAEYEKSNSIELSEAQQDAVRKLVANRVLVVTGLPGTGKTTLIRTFVRLFKDTGIHFMLMAPTGIAAKRLSAVTEEEAQTVHRALGYNGANWAHDAYNKLAIGAVIVDEMSMVDQELVYRLLTALDPATMLIMVGDDAQLPSVGPGNVLSQMVSCPDLPRVRLTQIFRQAHTSEIVLASHKINSGRNPLPEKRDKDSEFQFVSLVDEDRIVDLIVEMADKLKDRNANFQVLSPKHEGTVGVRNLNQKLRDRLNPEGPQREWKSGLLHVREGDRLMVVKNNYKLNVYNGDMGKLIAINRDSLLVRIHSVGRTPDTVVHISKNQAPTMLRLAYAITVHKCVDPETLVETPEGLVPAGDLPSEGEVATPTGRASYQNLVRNSSGSLLEIETTDGYSLRVTPDHGVDVWSPESSGYIRIEAQCLSEGHFLRLRLGAEFPDQGLVALPAAPGVDVRASVHRLPSIVTEDVAEFLGLFVADGTVYQRGFRLAKRHEDVADRFAQLCVELFGVNPKRFYTNNAHHVEVNSTQIASWLRSIGGLSPNEKLVPRAVLNSSVAVQRRFLRGLFEDGTVHVKSKLDHVELHSVSTGVRRAVRVMLLRLGIISGCGDNKIYIYGVNAKRFAEKVGFVAEFKTGRLEAPCGNETHYLVPVSRSEILEIVEANGGRSTLTHTDRNVFARGTMSRHHLADFLSRMGVHTPAWKALSLRLDFHHSRIRSISVYQGESVCVEVPEGHQFIQDGFCGWNSQGSEFNTVIMPIVRAQGRMLQRNLFYTAVTRAREKVWLLGDTSAVEKAILNDKVVQRNTVLGRAISEAVEAMSGVGGDHERAQEDAAGSADPGST